MALLDKYRDQLPPDLFTKPFKLPVTDGSGNNREAYARRADDCWNRPGGKCATAKLVDANGQPFTFEILLDQPAFERVALPYVQWLARLGIDARMCGPSIPRSFSKADADTYDYDMIVVSDRTRPKAPATSSRPATGPATA